MPLSSSGIFWLNANISLAFGSAAFGSLIGTSFGANTFVVAPFKSFPTLYIILVIDDYSRKALALEVVETQKTQSLIAVLENLFAQYGVPKKIMTDNFQSFTCAENRENHPFFLFCQSSGIQHLLTPTDYPESNGKVEALVKTVKRECVASLPLALISKSQLCDELDQFKAYYNWHRLHSGLSYDVPSASYCGVRLKSSLKAHPKLQGMSLPMTPMPEEVPLINRDFIHRHTALVPVSH